jgi:uncharacterized membrane protein YkvI
MKNNQGAINEQTNKGIAITLFSWYGNSLRTGRFLEILKPLIWYVFHEISKHHYCLYVCSLLLTMDSEGNDMLQLYGTEFQLKKMIVARLVKKYHAFYGTRKFHTVFKRHAGSNGCLLWLEHWDRGFEYHSRHICVSAFFCVVLSCVGTGLASGRSLVQGVLT